MLKLKKMGVASSVLCLPLMMPVLPAQAYNPKTTLETLVVTGTREAKALGEVAESVDVLQQDEIQWVSPAHPSEVLNRTAGVHVNNLSGEGHMTAIRQPITTGGVYLYLEDGIPTRPTGLFNHNALYEINVPQAERIEIIKGPGSALYGSDSIGGIINALTKPSPEEAELEINPEYGSYGWKRFLASSGSPEFMENMDTASFFYLGDSFPRPHRWIVVAKCRGPISMKLLKVYPSLN